MKHIGSSLLSYALLCSYAFAAETHASGLNFTKTTVLAPLKGTTVTAAYGKIKNDTDAAITLEVSGAKPFKAAELHETYEDQGKMGMRKIEQIKIEAHQTFELKAGGHHIMLFDASRTLKKGEKITIKFKANGKPMNATFEVTQRNDSMMDHSHHH